jgi:hypothetical protein
MSGSYVSPIPLKTGWWLAATAVVLLGCRPETIRDDRLFIRADALTAIKEQMRQPSTHHHQAFEALKWRVDQGDLSVYGSGINRYNRSFYAQELAFVCLMAEEEDQRQDYARRAFEAVQDIYRAPEQERLPHKDYGLSRAMMQQGLALPYAWCRTFWTEDQKQYVEDRIYESLDAWLTYDHANFGDTMGSNWVAVCRGGELVLLLSAGLREERAERYDFLVDQLLAHMQNGYGNLGTSQEGMGYTEYGGQFLLKAVFATASLGDSTLYAEARRHAWWKLAMYAESFQPHERKFLMTGVAGSGGIDEGWTSLLLNLVPDKEKSFYLWFYDRHMGRLAPGGPQDKFDSRRAGTIWSVLYYPVRAKTQDPTDVYPAGVADDRGYYYFRNRWRDANDILMSIMADGHHHGHAWDQPEVFALNLMAHNVRYVGGPSKDREDDLYSTLLVDGQYNMDGSVRLTGRTIDWGSTQQTAFVSINGGRLYQALGLRHAVRRLSLRFAEDNTGIVCIRDEVQTDIPRTLTWQLNLGDHQDGGGIEVVRSDGHFRLLSQQGVVDGWITGVEDLAFGEKDDPFQVRYRSGQSPMTVILYIHGDPGSIPSLIADDAGTTLNGIYRIRYDTDASRMVIEDQ